MKTIAALCVAVLLSGQEKTPAAVDLESGVAIPADKIALYIIDKKTTVRAAPSTTAPIVAMREPLTATSVRRATDAWFLLHWRENDEPRSGWVQFDPDNLIMDPSGLETFRKLMRLEKVKWSMAIKADVLRSRPRIGFNQEQVVLAIGEPRLKNETETAGGVSETWMYADRIIVFGPKGTVTAINTAVR